VTILTMRQCFFGHSLHAHFAKFINGNSWQVVLGHKVDFRLLKVAQTDNEKVAMPYALTASLHFIPVSNGFFARIVVLVFKIVFMQRGAQWHTVYITRRTGVRRVQIAMSIYPNYAKALGRVSGFYSGNSSTSITMIARKNNWKFILRQRFGHILLNFTIHACNTVQAFSIFCRLLFKDQVVFIFHLFHRILWKELRIIF